MPHGRVVAIHQNLRDDRHTLAANVAAYKFVVEGLLDHIAYSTLRIRPTGIKRHGMQYTPGVL